MLNQVESLASAHINPVIEALGYEVVEVTFKPIENIDTLTFFIYKKGGIQLSDCDVVSKAIDEPLEKLNLTEDKPYTLNVSSPGLDRLIVSEDDCRRNLDEDVEALLIKPLIKKSKVIGKLVAYTSEQVTLLTKGKEVVLQKSNIKVLRPYIKF